MSNHARFAAFALLVCLFTAVGCSEGERPLLGQVEGRITIGGEPLGKAIVMFLPVSGRPAAATTDKDGHYELLYSDGVKGCKAGPVTIGFAVPTGGATSHAIPSKYLHKSDLKREVKRGSQTFDLDLEATGNPVRKAAPRGQVVD